MRSRLRNRLLRHGRRLRKKGYMKMKRFTTDNFAGCLIGGAIGDALGYVVEFKESEDIFRIYGEEGLRDFSQEEDVFISDDTQMTMFTANGLLYHAVSGEAKGMSRTECLHAAYMDWLKSQEKEDAKGSDEDSISWLLNITELHERRAPGNTCLSALGSGRAGSISQPVNNSKGCGGIMRVAPIGLFIEDPAEAARQAARAAALTHGHPLGYIPAAAYAYIINRIIYTELELADIMSGCVRMISAEFPSYRETARLIELLTRAVRLAVADAKPHTGEVREKAGVADEAHMAADAALYEQPVVLAPPAEKYSCLDMKYEAARIEELGAGWTADETLAIAVYCCLRFGDDFETAVSVAANHSGDSDSTASLAGAIIGAAIGASDMPTKFIMLLELYDVLNELAEDLYDGCPASGAEACADEEAWRAKYIDRTYI